MSKPPERDIRIEKLVKLREQGIDPYPTRSFADYDIAELFEKFEKFAESEEPVQIAGRMVAFRSHGGSSFAHIQDRTGKIQLYFRKNIVGADKYKLLKMIDIGDFLNITGVLFTTRTGEQTVGVKDFTLISKSIMPLPEKWHGLQDEDLKVRYRYLDTIMDPDVKSRFETRSRIISAIRRHLDEKGFIEVETPVLQPLYGGASARPFTTHHNTMEMKLYMRIAIELYLKRLIIGGLEKVYEIGKIFRNEGIDRFHNPEFTMLELYEAYSDYHGMMELAENLLNAIAEYLDMGNKVQYNEIESTLKAPFKRIGFFESIDEYAGIDARYATDDELRSHLKSKNVDMAPDANRGQLLDEVFSEFVEPNLIDPTFVMDYPVILSPLAKRKPDDEAIVERFELFWFGMEIANAFTELNDPIDQRQRFEEQMSYRAKGDPEAQVLDEDFLEAMEHGMPPTGGIGFGIDRITMIFTDTYSLRDILLFPLTRPKLEAEAEAEEEAKKE
ncbi:MAG: lysine--tRNA ligase [Candidatus Zixiibacteriota bacterium]